MGESCNVEMLTLHAQIESKKDIQNYIELSKYIKLSFCEAIVLERSSKCLPNIHHRYYRQQRLPNKA